MLQTALSFVGLDSLNHVSELHKGSSFSIQQLVDGEWYEGIAKPFNQLIENINFLADADDIYLSQQSVIPFKRRCVDNISKLGCYWVDLDCYSVGLTQDEALSESLNIIKNQTLPTPSLIADSGRGLYLIWVLSRPVSLTRNVPNRAKRIAAWQNTENKLIELFKPVGSDPKASDAARVLRLAGTTNSKSDSTVRYWQSGNKLKSFDELSSALNKPSPDIKPAFEQKAKPSTKTKRKSAAFAGNRIFNRYTLAAKRMADIRTLAALRGGKLIDYRERAIYAYAVEAAYYCRERITLLNTVSQFMNDCLVLTDDKYNPDTPEKYIKTVLDRCEIVNFAAPNFEGDVRYKQKTSTVIEWLNITEREQQKMITLISESEKYRRKVDKRRKSGVVKRSEYESKRKLTAQDKAVQAKAMRNEGMKAKQIADLLSVSIHTVYSWFKN